VVNIAKQSFIDKNVAQATGFDADKRDDSLMQIPLYRPNYF